MLFKFGTVYRFITGLLMTQNCEIYFQSNPRWRTASTEITITPPADCSILLKFGRLVRNGFMEPTT